MTGPPCIAAAIARFATRRRSRSTVPLSILDATSALAERPLPDSICAVSAALGATGAAVRIWDPISAADRVLAVCGEWEGAPLEAALSLVPPLPFDRAPAEPLGCLRSRPEFVPLRADAATPISLVAFPIRLPRGRPGTLVLSDPRPMPPTGDRIALAHLVASIVTLAVERDRLLEQARRQGERISRLTSDVERLSNLLRRYSDGASR